MNNQVLEDMLTAAFETQASGAEGKVVLAYHQTKTSGNELLDFDGTLYDDQIPELLRLLEKAGVTEFTVSSTYSNMTSIFWEIQQHGWHATGLRKVNTIYVNRITGEHGEVPAWHFTNNA